MTELELIATYTTALTHRERTRALSQIIERSTPLVVMFARKAARRTTHLTQADLEQEGTIGVITALRTFDPSRGLAFSTYAGHAVRSQIRRAVDNTEREIRTPSWVGEGQRTYQRVAGQTRAKHGREPTHAEVEAGDSTTAKYSRTAMKVRPARLQSLDEPVSHGSDHERSLHELLPDGSTPLDEQYGQACRRATALRLLALLDSRELALAETAMGGRSLAEIGRDMGISRERARQIEQHAKRKMRGAALREGLRL